MFERRRFKCVVALMLGAFISGVVFLGYFCPDWVCSSSNPTSRSFADGSELSSSGFQPAAKFRRQDLEKEFYFDVEGDDVLVFLHIQKTGGTTFGRHLVKSTDISHPCVCYKDRKRCDCENSKQHIWLFSRYSTGWACGLHADWTELRDCVPKALNDREGESRNRRYLYFTILREPIQRYISEWKHVQRGSTWLTAKLMCNGRQATLDEVPFCFQGSDWTGVTLDDFMACQHNLAHNRQTRMLANLSLIGCYNQSAVSNRAAREQMMLRSAKENLRDIAFFGLTEFQAESRYLFERTFRLRFTTDFVQYSETHASKADVTPEQHERLLRLNHLDIELYAFAKRLFFARLEYARSSLSDGGRSEHFTKYEQDLKLADVDRSQPSTEYEESEETYDGEVNAADQEDAERKDRAVRAEKTKRQRTQRT